ncbi:MAG: PIN domain-containing protein [Burkholderiaceae bacterium]|nr:PIN domain-containing protein [Burkholderiaceae bacterium]
MRYHHRHESRRAGYRCPGRCAALRSPGGASAEILRRVVAGRVLMLANVALFTEYEAVLTRPEQLRAAHHSAFAMRRLLDELAERAVQVSGWYQWRPQLRDPADEMVLEAAVNGRADALVSFNRRDFGDAPARFGILLATPSQFLRSLEP